MMSARDPVQHIPDPKSVPSLFFVFSFSTFLNLRENGGGMAWDGMNRNAGMRYMRSRHPGVSGLDSVAEKGRTEHFAR